MLAALAACPVSASAQAGGTYGAFGPEGARMREQLWIVPGADPAYPLRATVFRPRDEPGAPAAPRPLVVINHGTSEATRLSVSMPIYYWLSSWFVERGFIVVLPQRRGHGATGGPLAEAVGSCAHPEHRRSGLAAAEDIGAVVDFMSGQPFVMPRSAVVVGVSTGGWASLALASLNPANVAAVINIAGGRGAYAYGKAGAVCGRDELVKAAAEYASTARIPTTWIYAANDSYFGPALAKDMAAAWRGAGGKADLSLVPAFGPEGHFIVDDRAGARAWGPVIDRTLVARDEVAAAPTSERREVSTADIAVPVRAVTTSSQTGASQ